MVPSDDHTWKLKPDIAMRVHWQNIEQSSGHRPRGFQCESELEKAHIVVLLQRM